MDRNRGLCSGTGRGRCPQHLDLKATLKAPKVATSLHQGIFLTAGALAASAQGKVDMLESGPLETALAAPRMGSEWVKPQLPYPLVGKLG